VCSGGFAAETQDLIANAQEKLKKKNLDLIVVNDVSERTQDSRRYQCRKNRLPRRPWKNYADAKQEVADQLLDGLRSLEKSS